MFQIAEPRHQPLRNVLRAAFPAACAEEYSDKF
jgi:hypothetical protein